MANHSDPAPWTPRGAYRSYVLVLLTLGYVLSYADRNLIAITQEKLRVEFHLADWELGLLGGVAFALLYASVGIPIARLAERRNRVAILSISMTIWSVMTAFCGLATSVVMLLAGRVGVGIGEAGGSPSSHSIISNYFPKARRTWALAVYSSGAPLGTILAALAGGWLTHTYGWRFAFLGLGVPGVILAVLIRFTAREPAREPVPAGEVAPKFSAALRYLSSLGTYRWVCAGIMSGSFLNAGLVQFTTSFYMRTHDFSLQQASLVFGFCEGLFAFFGALVGGAIADRGQAKTPRIEAWICAAAMFVCGALYIVTFHISNVWIGMGALLLASFFRWTFVGPAYGMMHNVTPDRMRATALAIYLFCSSLAAGAGSLALGAVSDLFAKASLAGHGVTLALCDAGGTTPAVCAAAKADGLQLAMTVFSAGYVVCGVMFLRAARFMIEEYKTQAGGAADQPAV